MKKLVIVLMALIMIGCSSDSRWQKQYYNYFDTVTTIISYDKSPEEIDKYVEERLNYYHQLFDIYHEYNGVNNIFTINKQAGKQAVEVSQDLLDFIIYARDSYKSSSGLVNIALGPVLKVWHDYRNLNNNTLPSIKELTLANAHTNIDNLVIDTTKKTVYLKDPLARLDVGALAKGYAVEMIVRELMLKGYNNLTLNAGGNVKCIGYKSGNKLWQVGIEDPFNSDQIIMKLQLTNKAVVTSGDYQRYFEVEGKRYSHIIDPNTLFPANQYRSVTVVSNDSALADYLSTLLFILPLEEAMKLVEELDDVQACFILSDHSIKYSKGFEAYLVP